MAAVQKRKNSYRAQVRRKGKSVSATFDTRQEAMDWAAQAETKLLQGSSIERIKSAPADPSAFTGAEMLRRYGDEVSPLKRGGPWEQVRLKKLARDYDIFRQPATLISGPDMARWRDKRLKEVSASSVHRELYLISAVFSKAIREWEVGVMTNPVSMIEKPKKPRPRTQRVSEIDRLSLEKQLGWNGSSRLQTTEQWAAAAFKLAVLTAMRRGEILTLDWGEIHFERQYAHLDMTKNGEERDVPLSLEAIQLLKLLGPGKSHDRVCPIEPGTLDWVFRRARRITKLLHVRFHDSRREATTSIASKFNILELSAITGHKDLQMLKIYYRPDPTDLAKRL